MNKATVGARQRRASRDGFFRYSQEVRGDYGNYKWPVKFDMVRGYVGINQEGERVLLSPAQMVALIDWWNSCGRSQVGEAKS